MSQQHARIYIHLALAFWIFALPRDSDLLSYDKILDSIWPITTSSAHWLQRLGLDYLQRPTLIKACIWDLLFANPLLGTVSAQAIGEIHQGYIWVNDQSTTSHRAVGRQDIQLPHRPYAICLSYGDTKLVTYVGVHMKRNHITRVTRMRRLHERVDIHTLSTGWYEAYSSPELIYHLEASHSTHMHHESYIS